MRKLTPYQQEYSTYNKTYAKCPAIMPSFIEYLRDRRDEAGKRKNRKEYARFSDLITEDIEGEMDYYTHEENAGRSDADPGL